MTKNANHNQNESSVITDLKSHIDKARQVQKDWAARPVKERVQTVRRIRQFIVDNSQQIAETISRENGKVLVDSLAAEVLPAAMAVSYYCKMAKQFLKPEKIKAGSPILSYKRSKLCRVPYGVVGIISPWNYPFSIPFSEVIMALLAGNAVILKTASNMPDVSNLLVNCI
ncbi:MAG: aldehyde dehydrogenase family protein, partial [bacterium]